MPTSNSTSVSRRKRARANQGPRERVLAAANDLFYRRGIRNVGIDEIISTAGVAKASLYNHFPSKDDLVAEYVRLRGAEWWDWFRSAVEAQAATPSQRLIAVFDVLGDWISENTFRGCALQNACVELADSLHAGHRVALADKRALWAYLADLATQAGASDPQTLADQLALLFEGAIMIATIDASATPAKAARAAATVLVRSL